MKVSERISKIRAATGTVGNINSIEATFIQQELILLEVEIVEALQEARQEGYRAGYDAGDDAGYDNARREGHGD